MSLLSKYFSNGYNTTNIDARLNEVDDKLRKLEERVVEADDRVVEEMLESGASPSAKLVDELRREIAHLSRARAVLEQERSVVAQQEEEIRVAKAWRATNDFGRHRANRAAVIEGLFTQLLTEIEQAIADDARHIEMTPQLPEGFEHAEPLEASLLAAARDQFHGANFRDHARRPSPAAKINYRVALVLRDRPDELHLGTQRLLKPSPLHDASAKA